MITHLGTCSYEDDDNILVPDSRRHIFPMHSFTIPVIIIVWFIIIIIIISFNALMWDQCARLCRILAIHAHGRSSWTARVAVHIIVPIYIYIYSLLVKKLLLYVRGNY